MEKKIESLKAENTQLQLTLERKHKMIEDVNNQLILETAKCEHLENDNKELNEICDKVIDERNQALDM